MAIWDNITKKAAEISEKAVKQAKDLSEVAKLKMQIAEAEGTAEDTYAQLGRLYAAAHPEEYEEGFASLMAAAANAENTIKTLREQLREAKGVAVCEKCGAEVSKDSAFCSACGAEIPKKAPVEAEVITEEAPVEEVPVVEKVPVEEETPAETVE